MAVRQHHICGNSNLLLYSPQSFFPPYYGKPVSCMSGLFKGGGGRGRCEELGMSKGFLDRFTDNSVEDANEYRNSFGTKQTVVGNTYSMLSRIA